MAALISQKQAATIHKHIVLYTASNPNKNVMETECVYLNKVKKIGAFRLQTMKYVAVPSRHR